MTNLIIASVLLLFSTTQLKADEFEDLLKAYFEAGEGRSVASALNGAKGWVTDKESGFGPHRDFAHGVEVLQEIALNNDPALVGKLAGKLPHLFLVQGINARPGGPGHFFDPSGQVVKFSQWILANRKDPSLTIATLLRGYEVFTELKFAEWNPTLSPDDAAGYDWGASKIRVADHARSACAAVYTGMLSILDSLQKSIAERVEKYPQGPRSVTPWEYADEIEVAIDAVRQKLQVQKAVADLNKAMAIPMLKASLKSSGLELDRLPDRLRNVDTALDREVEFYVKSLPIMFEVFDACKASFKASRDVIK